MPSIIKIKRSGTQGSPASLKSGELAYSYFSGANRLYFGKGDDGNGNATEIIVIGGQYFTDMLDHTPGVLTTSSAVITDADNKVDVFNVDNLRLDLNTISSTNLNGNIILAPNGTGAISLYNVYTLPSTAGIAGQALVTNGSNAASWGTPNTATNIAAGTAGQIVYQSAAGATAFAGPGTAGQVLTSGGTGAPTYVTTTTLYVGRALTADSASGTSNQANNLNGGILGQIAYQTAPNTTAFIGTGTQGSILQMGANTATFVTTASIYVNSAVNALRLFGGTAGQLVYQSAAGTTAFAGPGTAGQILVSAGTSAPTYTNTGSIYVGFANQSNNLLAGTAGQLVYQSAAGTTAFAGPGTAGQILVSAGTSAPAYTNTGSIYVGFANQSNNLLGGILGQIAYQTAAGTTAFIGTGTAGTILQMGANTATFVTTASVYVNSAVNAQRLFGGTAGQLVYQSAAGVTAFAGPGTAGQLLVSAGTGAPAYTSTGTIYVGFANQSNNLLAGTAGQIPYQTGAGATSFFGPGTTGQILVSAGTNAPTYTNTSSIQVGFAATAGQVLAANTSTQQVGFSANLLAGTAGQLVYQSAANTTAFAGPGTAGQILLSNGTSGPVYTNTASVYVNSAVNAQTLFGGTAGQLVYQSGAGTTAFAGPGTAGQILVSAGTGAPTYTNTSTIQVGFAANILAGAAGSVPYQTAANATAMLALSGTSGALLTAGASAPAYITQVTARNGTGSISTASGQSLVVSNGGLGVIGNSHFADNVNVRGELSVSGGTTFNGSVTFNGTATFVYSTNTFYTDNIVNIHTPPGGIANTWTTNDGKDIGLVYHNFVDGYDNDAFLGWHNETGYLEWFDKGSEVSTGTFVHTRYGTFKTGAILLDNNTGVNNATSGALQVNGGVGVGGGLFVAGVVTATTFIGALTGTATQANNLNNGTAGQLVYQSGPNTTAFAGPGTAGQILVSAGTSAPTYTNTSSIQVGFAATAGLLLAANTGTQQVGFSSNLLAGTAGQIPYQSAANTTVFAGPGTAGQILVSNGTSGPQYTNTSSIQVGFAATAGQVLAANTGTQQVGFSANLLAGTAGQLVYQTGPNTTAFAGPGTAGQILLSNGTSGPVYTNTASVYVNSAVNAEKWTTARTVTFTGDTTGTFTIDGSANVSNVALTIQPDSVALGTDTTGNYVEQGATAGWGLSGSVNSEGGTFTVTSNATSTNTVSTLVFRDGSGNFRANVVTADLVGTASNANDLTGGTAGAIPYQSAIGVTDFLALGAAGKILQVNDAGTSIAWGDIDGGTY